MQGPTCTTLACNTHMSSQHSVHRFLVQMAGLCALVSRHLKTCTAHLSIELCKMRYLKMTVYK